MYFSSRELESRYERVYNEEHAQSDVLATSLMMACCAINWLVLSQPYGRHIHAVQSAALISLTIGSIFMQVLAVGWPGLYKRHRTVLMASLRVVCNAVTTATMPAYHQYLAANMPGNTQLVRIVHLLVDGMPIVPAFVALVFPILWHTHLWLLISAHAHLVLSQWFDCVTLVASPILSAAYSAPDVDVVTQPTAALSAVRYCRRVNIVGQVLSLLVSGIYSWRKELAHRQQFLKAAYDYNMSVGGDVRTITSTKLEVFRRPKGFRKLMLLELLYVFPFCWATLYRWRNDERLLTIVGLSPTPRA